jgi:hypothetical protein
MKMDQLSQRILTVSLSIMGILLCTTLFFATISPASANSSPSANNGSAMETGRILMDYTSVHVPSQDKTYYEVLVWDSVTGASKLYYFSYNDKTFKAYDDNVQLPSNPLD